MTNVDEVKNQKRKEVANDVCCDSKAVCLRRIYSIGFRKIIFNPKDFGVIVIKTYPAGGKGDDNKA